MVPDTQSILICGTAFLLLVRSSGLYRSLNKESNPTPVMVYNSVFTSNHYQNLKHQCHLAL